MKYETHMAGQESAKKQQERIRYYDSKAKEIEAGRRRKAGGGDIRKQVQNG